MDNTLRNPGSQAVGNLEGLNYTVCLKFGERRRFLLWQDGAGQPNSFVTVPGAAQFLAARTMATLQVRARYFGLQVAEQEPYGIDMDRLFKVLEALRPDRALSQATCQTLLDGWNMLEDMARALRIQLGEQKAQAAETLKKAYDKLFSGHTQPATAAPDATPAPVFSADERKTMRQHLRNLWQEIFKRGGLNEEE